MSHPIEQHPLWNHELVDEQDRQMQYIAERCMNAGVGHTFKHNTGRREVYVEVKAIDESEITYAVRGYAGVHRIPREPLRAAVTVKTLQAQAATSARDN